MMGGMLTMSIISGQLISRTGRYKVFPVIGTGIMTGALFLLSRLSIESSAWVTSGCMLLLGVGLGMVMQVLVIAVQNAIAYRDLGVATSGATLFRLIGGSLGTAVLGAIFAVRLSANLARLLPAGGPSGTSGSPGMHVSAEALAHFSPAQRLAYATAFTASLNTVFLVAAIVCFVGFALTWLLPERPLRRTVAESAANAGNEAGEAFGLPADEESAAARLYAALTSLSDRDVQRQHIERIVARAGETLSPLAAWLLSQLDREPQRNPLDVARAQRVDGASAQRALAELRERGLIASTDGATAIPSVTPAGCDVLDRLAVARRAHLAELGADWESAGSPDARDYLADAVKRIVPDAQRLTSRPPSAAGRRPA
jgi:DNA-binding MarR family transcriptional regulator